MKKTFYLILTTICCISFNCVYIMPSLFCPKCVSAAFEIDIYDFSNTNRILNPNIILTRPNGEIDSLTANNVHISDSSIFIFGGAGIYKIEIQKEGYKDIKLDSVRVFFSGNPKCGIVLTDKFQINMIRNDNGKDTSEIIHSTNPNECCK
jgi:hypothetical protein